MGLLGDRKTKQKLRAIKPRYRLKARDGEYIIYFDFSIPSGVLLDYTMKISKHFKIQNVDLDNLDSFTTHESYNKKLLKRIQSWIAGVEKDIRKKHQNNFTLISRHLEYASFNKQKNQYNVEIKITGTFTD